MTSLKTLSLLAAISATSAMTANAAVIYEASDSNTTAVINGVTGAAATATGDTATGSMSLLVTGNNFAYGGFASTQTINALNGTAITDTDIVTVTFTTGDVDPGLDTNGALRSRGFNMGIAASTAFDGGGSADQLIINVRGGNNITAIDLANSSNAGPASTGSSLEDASAGITVTIVADVNGWTASFTDNLGTSLTADLTGSFDAGEFTSFIGNGHLYAGFQQWQGGADGVTVPFEVASVDVTPIPEPGSLALLGLGGLLIDRRRRG